MEKENKYRYWLATIEGLGTKRYDTLIKKFGSEEEIYKAKKEELMEVKGIGEKLSTIIIKDKEERNLEKEISYIEEKNIKVYFKDKEGYPQRLSGLENMPKILFVRGELPKEKIPSVAIVGARMCSPYGKTMANQCGRIFAHYGINVISGMAMGIDGSAHLGALNKGGKSFGILGCGVDVCYPRENFNLYRKMCTGQGGIISSFLPKSQPKACNFPIRNAYISGLCDLLIVVEAKKKSGSLITAEFAIAQGKDIYAFPGRITDNLSGGCNKLIEDGAGIITGEEDIEELAKHLLELKKIKLGGDISSLIKLTDKKALNEVKLEKKELLVYSCLSLQPKYLEEIFREVDLRNSEIISILMDLIIEGLVWEPVKNYYACY
ncbi:DNA processing protein [Acetitomaculum ruminis DSM 5522]|uniref:DNA processing protein n=1 Tax=Acetitomaculum ruminis DSM 5522 TaxID=1120918 RepID=A0A1I0ZHP0_9FIRM|nr:DNA-processing protein DprA [Acetitomaculum ruminis]SFB24892.1 DNA processing protein [Acetitomaculum ruminis DSM 5522]